MITNIHGCYSLFSKTINRIFIRDDQSFTSILTYIFRILLNFSIYSTPINRIYSKKTWMRKELNEVFEYK